MKRWNLIARHGNPFLTFDKWSMLAQSLLNSENRTWEMTFISFLSMEKDKIRIGSHVCLYGPLSSCANYATLIINLNI